MNRPARGALTEIYYFAPASVEHSYRFDALPTRGELALRIGVHTDLAAADLADGVAFAGPGGAVRYEHALVVDAADARLPLTIVARDGDLELVVPAAFVAAARWSATGAWARSHSATPWT